MHAAHTNTLEPPTNTTPVVFTARPRPAFPVLLQATSAALFVCVGASIAQSAFVFAGVVGAAALLPFSRRPLQQSLGRWLAYGGIAFCFVAIFLVPLSSRVTALFLPACVLFMFRFWALGTESVQRFFLLRWSRGITENVFPLHHALDKALHNKNAADVDKAIVALAAAEPSIIPEDENDRRAFWIDVYNVLSCHANRGRYSTRIWDVLEVYRTSYEIAGARYTLDDIEHGLLRNGAPNPASPWTRMDASDPRKRFAVSLDPRIHFALNCGAYSCPPVRNYRGKNIDEALELAANGFLAAASRIDEAKGVIETSKLLLWYERDFGGRAGVIARIARALEVDEDKLRTFRLRYDKYDWTNNVPG
jgi:hypothetical protein